MRTHGSRLLAAALAAVAVVLCGTSTATAADLGGTVVPVIADIRPALPPDAVVAFARSGELAATSREPLAVAGPDGRDFLRISARGVDVDAGHPFTYQSQTPPGAATVLPDGVQEGAPQRWVHVSDDASWHWYDPRTRPPGVRAPAGGRAGAAEVLATWSIPMRHGDTPTEVDGRLELRPPSDDLLTDVAAAPDGMSAVVSPSDPPSVVLRAPAGTPVTVLGSDGEPFLRRTADDRWEASLDSRTYRLGLLRSINPVPPGTGWVPYADAGPLGWTDDRLVAPQPALDAARAAATPSDVAQWEIPVLVADRPAALRGTVRYVPGPGTAGRSGSTTPALLGLGAAVVLLGAGLGALVLRNRRLATAPRPRAGSTDETDETDRTDANDETDPEREGVPHP